MRKNQNRYYIDLFCNPGGSMYAQAMCTSGFTENRAVKNSNRTITQRVTNLSVNITLHPITTLAKTFCQGRLGHTS